MHRHYTGRDCSILIRRGKWHTCVVGDPHRRGWIWPLGLPVVRQWDSFVNGWKGGVKTDAGEAARQPPGLPGPAVL